ncbi:MAG: RidA family protein [Phycisphaerales bacterium]
MPDLRRISTGAVWEDRYGYSRAIRAGNLVFFTGTAPPVVDGAVVHPGDAYAQTLACYAIIEKGLAQLGLTRTNIVRCRMFVTDIQANADAHGRAHKAFFADHKPCLTMVGGAQLIDPAMLVEIEIDAVTD